jgi:hypothetical protein
MAIARRADPQSGRFFAAPDSRGRWKAPAGSRRHAVVGVGEVGDIGGQGAAHEDIYLGLIGKLRGPRNSTTLRLFYNPSVGSNCRDFAGTRVSQIWANQGKPGQRPKARLWPVNCSMLLFPIGISLTLAGLVWLPTLDTFRTFGGQIAP